MVSLQHFRERLVRAQSSIIPDLGGKTGIPPRIHVESLTPDGLCLRSLFLHVSKRVVCLPHLGVVLLFTRKPPQFVVVKFVPMNARTKSVGAAVAPCRHPLPVRNKDL